MAQIAIASLKYQTDHGREEIFQNLGSYVITNLYLNIHNLNEKLKKNLRNDCRYRIIKYLIIMFELSFCKI